LARKSKLEVVKEELGSQSIQPSPVNIQIS